MGWRGRCEVVRGRGEMNWRGARGIRRGAVLQWYNFD